MSPKPPPALNVSRIRLRVSCAMSSRSELDNMKTESSFTVEYSRSRPSQPVMKSITDCWLRGSASRRSACWSTMKDDSVFMLSSSLRDDMAQETRSLILDTFSAGGGFGDMLTADHSFLNAELATYYGFDASGLGSAFVRVPYPGAGARDGGILAHAG